MLIAKRNGQGKNYKKQTQMGKKDQKERIQERRGI
jgi:hypothetical protein